MALAPGAQFGPYQILTPIGAGGMGEVYRARDTRLDRVVAIKILPPSLAQDEAARARFEREAKAVAALSDPHILAIYDVDVQGATAYVVMELLEGETLRDRDHAGAAAAEQSRPDRARDRAGPVGGAREGTRASRYQARERVRHH